MAPVAHIPALQQVFMLRRPLSCGQELGRSWGVEKSTGRSRARHLLHGHCMQPAPYRAPCLWRKHALEASSRGALLVEAPGQYLLPQVILTRSFDRLPLPPSHPKKPFYIWCNTFVLIGGAEGGKGGQHASRSWDKHPSSATGCAILILSALHGPGPAVAVFWLGQAPATWSFPSWSPAAGGLIQYRQKQPFSYAGETVVGWRPLLQAASGFGQFADARRCSFCPRVASGASELAYDERWRFGQMPETGGSCGPSTSCVSEAAAQTCMCDVSANPPLCTPLAHP